MRVAQKTNASFVVAAVAWLVATGTVSLGHANDIDIGEQAGDVIGKIADVTRSFKLSDIPANLEIEADEMSFDYDQGALNYRGNVRVRHGDVRMRSDILQLEFGSGRERALQSIKATGNVEVLRGEERATGQTASYEPDRQIITLTGKASLGSGSNNIGGESVIVYMAERRAEVKGRNERTGESGRVHAVIDPDTLDLLGEPKSQ